MRKVKYTHMNYHEKLTQILTDFPRLDDIHPFYADLINVRPHLIWTFLNRQSARLGGRRPPVRPPARPPAAA